MVMVNILSTSIIQCDEINVSLLSDYDFYKAPQNKTGGPLDVTIKIRRLRVIEVHNRKQLVTVALGFVMQWIDDRILISGRNKSKPKVSSIIASITCKIAATISNFTVHRPLCQKGLLLRRQLSFQTISIVDKVDLCRNNNFQDIISFDAKGS